MADPQIPTQQESGGVVRGITRTLASIFGITPDRTMTPETIPDSTPNQLPPIRINQLTETELRHLPGFGANRDQDRSGMTPDSILQVFGDNVASAEKQLQNIESLKMLTPEIEKAMKIYVGSILAPNDLQIGKVNIVVDVPDFEAEKNEALSQLFSDFFNEHYNLGTKLKPWLEDTLFRHGSKAIMVYPRDTNINFLNELMDIENPENAKAAAARVAATYSTENYDVSNESLGYEGLSAGVLNQTDIIDSITTEAYGVLYDDLSKDPKIDSAAIEDFAVNFDTKARPDINTIVKKLLADADKYIKVSLYPKAIQQVDPTAINANLDEKFADNHFFGGTTNPIYNVNDQMGKKPYDYSGAIEFSPDAVIPVIVPGTPESHIGYFVITGGHSIPMSNLNSPSSWQERSMSAAGRAYFGNNNVPYLNQIAHATGYDAVAKIFGLTVKTMLKNKLDAQGIMESDILKYEAVTNCLFRHLLMKKKIGIVFVPESIMVYYRFDHRPNGCGKSKLEDLYSVISLRSTLMVASIMAAVRDSMDRQRITVPMDEKNVNPEQLLDTVREVWINKRAFKFDADPTRIGRELVNKSVAIIPTGVRGLPESIKVESEDMKSSRVYPPKEFLEELSSWVVDGLGVPPAAMNQSGEHDYAITVATNNVYYSNDIRQCQAVTVKYTNKFICLYIKYSIALHRKIKEILHPQKTKQETKAEKEEAVGQDIGTITTVAVPNKKNAMADVLKDDLFKILNNLTIVLPSPNVSTDKAHFKEIKEFAEFLDTVLNSVYPSDVMFGEVGSKYADATKAMRAVVKADLMREYVLNLGMFSDLTIPNTDTLNTDNISKHILKAMNLHKEIANMGILDKTLQKPDDMSAPGSGMDFSNPGGDMGSGSPTDSGVPGGAPPPAEDANLELPKLF